MCPDSVTASTGGELLPTVNIDQTITLATEQQRQVDLGRSCCCAPQSKRLAYGTPHNLGQFISTPAVAFSQKASVLSNVDTHLMSVRLCMYVSLCVCLCVFHGAASSSCPRNLFSPGAFSTVSLIKKYLANTTGPDPQLPAAAVPPNRRQRPLPPPGGSTIAADLGVPRRPVLARK